MSLDKAILYGKEHRSCYHGSKSFDKTCRSHGGCPYCESNRKHSERLKRIRAKEQIVDFFRGDNDGSR